MSDMLTTIFTSGAIGVVLVAVVGLVGTLRSLHANKPVVDSTADEKLALANASSFGAQQGVIKTLNDQLDRQNSQLARQEERISMLEKKIAWATARVEERDEQNELLAAQLRTSRDENVLLKDTLAACRRSGKIMSDWVHAHWEAEHAGEDPHMPDFRVDAGGL